jgi:hypothetical protein
MCATITAFTTTAPLTGYKIADRRCCPTVGPKVPYVVGERYSLGDDEPLKLCLSGYHFCPVASHCMATVAWRRGHRLLRVHVPAGVAVQHDSCGKYVARTIVVDADVTDDAATLLTGLARKMRYDRLETKSFKNGELDRNVDDEPANVVRELGYVEKTWCHYGKIYNGFQKRYARAVWWDIMKVEEIALYRASCDRTYWVSTTMTPADPGWDATKQLVVRQESFECDKDV